MFVTNTLLLTFHNVFYFKSFSSLVTLLFKKYFIHHLLLCFLHNTPFIIYYIAFYIIHHFTHLSHITLLYKNYVTHHLLHYFFKNTSLLTYYIVFFPNTSLLTYYIASYQIHHSSLITLLFNRYVTPHLLHCFLKNTLLLTYYIAF